MKHRSTSSRFLKKFILLLPFKNSGDIESIYQETIFILFSLQ